MNEKVTELLLKILRKGLDASFDCEQPSPDAPWRGAYAIAQRQGLSAICCDGLNAWISESGKAPFEDQTLLLRWFASVPQFEDLYGHHLQVVRALSRFYARHGINMMVLKGLGLSLGYPSPRHRPCGDIDIWLFNESGQVDYREADGLLEKELGIKVDNSHHHHSVFFIDGVMIENHYDFINVHAHRSSKEFEQCLHQNVGKPIAVTVNEEGKIVPEDGHDETMTSFYIPSPDMGVLFLLRHTASHFAAEQATLRQILDWGFYIRSYGSQVDWDKVNGIVRHFNMDKFLSCICEICTRYLGFDWEVAVPAPDKSLVDRVFNDIIEPEFNERIPKGFLSGIWQRWRRWRANSWKHRITYSESLWTTFWHQVVAHLMKPSSLKS